MKTMEFENSPIGFASVNAFGQNGTTGGAGGDTLVFTSRAPLQAFMNTRGKTKAAQPPKIIIIDGTITNDTSISQIYVKRVANMTIIGKGNNALLDGLGLAIVGSRNIIVRNIQMRNAKPDCITINTTTSDTCHHIWIDHCTFSDDPEIDLSSNGTHDGLLDITHRTSYITVSWCEFHNHDKVSLLGYTDNATDEIPYLYTTYHHNWWNNTVQRHPRVRHTLCHVFNNYYDGTNPPGAIGMGIAGGYGIASTCEADLYVEANYFDKVINPTNIGEGNSPAGDLLDVNNITNNSGTILTRNTHTTPFSPSTYYTYKADTASNVPALVKAGAGAGKLYAPTAVTDNDIKADNFALRQNYPNPFNPTSTITYSLKTESDVVIKVYNTIGKEVATLVNAHKSAGTYNVIFNASALPSGMYLYKMQAGSFSSMKKMILLK
jgi:pectate lyase